MNFQLIAICVKRRILLRGVRRRIVRGCCQQGIHRPTNVQIILLLCVRCCPLDMHISAKLPMHECTGAGREYTIPQKCSPLCYCCHVSIVQQICIYPHNSYASIGSRCCLDEIPFAGTKHHLVGHVIIVVVLCRFAVQKNTHFHKSSCICCVSRAQHCAGALPAAYGGAILLHQ